MILTPVRLLIRSKDLISHLRDSLPKLPDRMVETLAQEYGLTMKDAGTLLSLENGDRLDYFFEVLTELQKLDIPGLDQTHLGKVTGNW